MYLFNRHTSNSENEILEIRNDIEPITENLNSQSTISLNDFDQPSTSSSNISSDSTSNINFISNSRIRRKRQKLNNQNTTSDKLLSSERTEEIHKAL